MRKLMTVLLGLLLMFGATGVLAYRLYDAPERAESAGKGNLRAPDTGVASKDRLARRYYEPEAGGWQLFSAAVDVLNVIVGLIGIGLTISGVRMRRGPMRQELGGMRQEM